jgi:hypothetical protein
MFSFQQGFWSQELYRIVDSCQHLIKLGLTGYYMFDDDDTIYIINKLGKQLTTLRLSAGNATDVGYLHLKNCAR